MGKHQDINFKNDIGLHSTIQREKGRGEHVKIANQKLADLGESFNPVPGTLKYMGSCAVHIFYSETLQQVFFASQTDGLPAHKCPEILAQSATTDLVGSVMESYGHKRPTKRSGF